MAKARRGNHQRFLSLCNQLYGAGARHRRQSKARYFNVGSAEQSNAARAFLSNTTQKTLAVTQTTSSPLGSLDHVELPLAGSLLQLVQVGAQNLQKKPAAGVSLLSLQEGILSNVHSKDCRSIVHTGAAGGYQTTNPNLNELLAPG